MNAILGYYDFWAAIRDRRPLLWTCLYNGLVDMLVDPIKTFDLRGLTNQVRMQMNPEILVLFLMARYDTPRDRIEQEYARQVEATFFGYPFEVTQDVSNWQWVHVDTEDPVTV